MIPFPLTLDGTIERRILINYRLDPAVARELVPSPLRPLLVAGSAVAGVCLIRLGTLRPSGMPPAIGWRAENAAHRIAVEWDDDGATRRGVYIPERHSDSWPPIAAGGRVFPGAHHRARFEARESASHLWVQMTSESVDVAADIEISDDWDSSLFPSLDDASRFFREGAVGWSPDRSGRALEGLRLDTRAWEITAARASRVSSSFFDALPHGAASLDNVLVMRDIPVRWRAHGRTIRVGGAEPVVV